MGNFFYFLVFCFLVGHVFAVDKSNFKTCHQSSFCQRHRRLSDDPFQPNYQFIEDSFVFNEESIQADILNTKSGTLLTFELNVLENDKVRFRIDEKTPLHARYKVNDVVVGGTKAASYVKTISKDVLTIQFGSNKLVIQKNPFKLEILIEEESVVVVNAKGLMMFEHYREKKEPKISSDSESSENADKNEVEEKDEEGMWEETFKGHKDDKPKGPSSVGVDVTFPGSTHVYGIPEHAMGLSLLETKRGSQVVTEPYRLYNLDVFEYEIDVTMALYGAIPFIMSHRPGYTVGLLWLNSAETWVDIDKSSSGLIEYSTGKAYTDRVDAHWFSESGIIDVFVFLNKSPRGILNQYTSVTGTTALPPMYAIAYHQCTWNYVDEEDVSKVDEGFDEHNIPYDVLWLDIEHTDSKKYFTWNSVKFPTPTNMQMNLANKFRRMVTIVDPHIKRDSGYEIHIEAQQKGLYVKNKDSNDFDGWCWPGSSSWIDFTNPEARSWWSSLFSLNKYQGSTNYLSIWNDMNEPSVFNGPEVTMHKTNLHHQGWEHRDVHNIYGFYQHMATAQGLKLRDNKRPFVLSRAFFAGSQRYGAIWTGDNKADWSHLKISVPMLLSLGISGLTFSGADVGGFFGNPEEELFVRWYQAGAFQPFFRGHAHIDTKRREPWLKGEPYTSHIREAIQTRYTLLPLWYTLFHQASLDGSPVIRPIFYEYPDEVSTFSMDDQYLVGSHLLVKPITSKGETSVGVFFPGEGEKWYDYWTFKAHMGGKTETQPVNLGKIPVYIRGGSVIPKKERIRRSSKIMEKDPYTLVVALDSKGVASGNVYIDDGISFDFENGVYFWKNISFENNVLKNINVGSSGKFRPNVEDDIERIIILGLKKAPSKITYEGQTISYTYDQQTQSATLKKPNVEFGSDWEILFN